MRRGDVGALHVHAGAKVLGVMYAGGMEVYAGHANKAVCCPPPPRHTTNTHTHLASMARKHSLPAARGCGHKSGPTTAKPTTNY